MTSYLLKNRSNAALVLFRILFGLLLLLSCLRFWFNGWIETLYLKPQFFFSYFGWDWIKPYSPSFTYALFGILALSSLFICLGLFYRISSISAFISFTYIELIDKSTYLNHYYFVSLVLFGLCFVDANRRFSLDCLLKPSLKSKECPNWQVLFFQLQMATVYFFAGIAKWNSDWLLEALPLKLWLPAKYDTPIIGPLLDSTVSAYVFSWAGMLFDCLIPFFLFNTKTSPYAYVAVLLFHLLTSMLFPIGMFPYIMMVGTWIFFPPTFHERILGLFEKKGESQAQAKSLQSIYPLKKRVIGTAFCLYFAIQWLVPFRYAFYEGDLFWTEQGFRFSWRVMLMEKNGYTNFIVKDPNEGKLYAVNSLDYLSPMQEKMMCTQPDMILQFAHYLAQIFEKRGISSPEVYVDSYVSVNGRPAAPYVISTVNLAKEKEGIGPWTWLHPFEENSNKRFAP